MRSPIVIDTNVLLAANQMHPDISSDCVAACASRLRDIQVNYLTVIDDQFRILSEYQKKSSPRNGKGVGDVFLKWLLQNSANKNVCAQVSLTETNEDEYLEFPDKKLESQFDKSDRKFVAVASVHPDKPKILQATDCKWLDWHGKLRELGIEIEFLCIDDICEFYRRKFPDRKVPEV